jgi:hypothetical protein
MATGRAVLQIHIDDLQGESIPLDWAWTLTAAVFKRETLAWGPGDQTLSNIPVGTTFIIIEPPANTPGLLKTKGVGGDTGVVIRSSVPTPLTYGGSGSVILNASMAVTGIEITYV